MENRSETQGYGGFEGVDPPQARRWVQRGECARLGVVSLGRWSFIGTLAVALLAVTSCKAASQEKDGYTTVYNKLSDRIVQLPSGDSIEFQATGPAVVKGEKPGLMLTFYPFVSLTDTARVKQIALSLFGAVEPQLDPKPPFIVLRAVSVRAAERNKGGFYNLDAFGVVVERRQDGRWYRLDEKEPVQVPGMSAEYIHDQIVAMIRRNAGSIRLPPGDTLVAWRTAPQAGPILYTTVGRTDSTVASSLVRNDGWVGISEALWRNGRQARVHVKWTKGDSVLSESEISVAGRTLRVQGTRDTTLTMPPGPWLVADYGMEDQALPLVQQLEADSLPHEVAVYRPYARKLDTVRMAVMKRPWGRVVNVTEPEGKVDYWQITPGGALVRMTNDKEPEFERRPLELTRLVPDYLRIRQAEAEQAR